MRRKMFLVFLLTFALAVGFTACSEDSEEDPAARVYLGTQAPGDVWEWTIATSGGSGTFSATNRTLSYDYSGSVTTLPNQFLVLTVTDSTEPGITLPAEAYALEIPDSVLFVKPVSDPEVIVCAAQGACPSVSTSYNWVNLLKNPFDSATDTAYGIAASTVTGTGFDFTNNYYLMDGSASGSETITDFACTDGEFSHTGGNTVFGMTPSGVFIGDNGPGDGGFVGMEAPASNINIAGVVAAGIEYRGMLFKDKGSGGESTPIWSRPDGSGGLTGGEYDDFEAGTESTDHAMISFTTQNSPGVVNGTLTESSGTNPILFMINQIDGRYYIYGAGYSTSSPAEPYNFFVIEM